MIFTSDLNIEDFVVVTLAEHTALTAKSIHKSVAATGRGVSIQAVYDALRKLIRSNVIVKYRNTYELSAEWRTQVAEKLQRIPSPPQLKEQESLRYTFNSYVQLDIFWKHLNSTLQSTYPRDPIFFFNPHEFWIFNLDRGQSQVEYIKRLRDKRDGAFMLIGGDTLFDITYRDTYREYLSISIDVETTLPRNRHYTICGDYIITTKIPVTAAEEIDQLYKKVNTLELLQEGLRAIFLKTSKLTVHVQKNKNRARDLRRKISKTMYIPRTLKEQYRLFD